MCNMATIRSLGRQLACAGEEIQSLADEIDLLNSEEREVLEIYNSLMIQHLEKAQVIILMLTQKLFGTTDEGTHRDGEDSDTVSVAKELDSLDGDTGDDGE